MTDFFGYARKTIIKGSDDISGMRGIYAKNMNDLRTNTTPEVCVVDTNDNIVLGVTNGIISRYIAGYNDANGDIFTNLWGIVGVGSDLYASTNGKIISGTRTGSKTIHKAGLSGARGIAYDGVRYLYIAEKGLSDGQGRVLSIDLNTYPLAFTLVASGFTNPSDVALHSNGTVYVADTGNHRVMRVLPGGTVEPFKTGLNSPFGVEVHTDGYVYIADTGGNRLLRCSVQGGRDAIETGFSSPYGVAVSETGIVYVADNGNNQIVKYTPTQYPWVLLQPTMADYIPGLPSTTRFKILNNNGRLYLGGGVTEATYTFKNDSYNSTTPPTVPGLYSIIMSNVIIRSSGRFNPIVNYTIDYLEGTVTVKKMPITITTTMVPYASGSPSNVVTSLSNDLYGDHAVYQRILYSSGPNLASTIGGFLTNPITTPPTSGAFRLTSVNYVHDGNGNDVTNSYYTLTASISDSNVLPAPLTSVTVVGYISDYYVDASGSSSIKYKHGPLISNWHVLNIKNYSYTSKDSGIVYTIMPTIAGTYIFKFTAVVQHGSGADVTNMYSFNLIETEFIVTKRSAIINPIISNYVSGSPSGITTTTTTGLRPLEIVSTYDYSFTNNFAVINGAFPTTPGTHTVYVRNATIKSGIYDVTSVYTLSYRPYSFTVFGKKPATITPELDDYVSGMPSKIRITSSGLDTGDKVLSYEYSFTSNFAIINGDFPTAYGTHTVYVRSAVITSNTKVTTSNYDIVYDNYSFYVSPNFTIFTPYVADYESGSPSEVNVTTTTLNAGDRLDTFTYYFTSSSYSDSNFPTIPGLYTVNIQSFSVTDGNTDTTSNYTPLVDIATFNVLPKKLSVSVVVPDYKIGNPSTPVTVHDTLMDGHSIDLYTYTYTLKDTSNSSTVLPKAVGTYTATCTPIIKNITTEEVVTSMYSPVPIVTEFTVSKTTVTITPSLDDYESGTPALLTASGPFNIGDRLLSYEYSFTAQAPYTTVFPTIPGLHNVYLRNPTIIDEDGVDTTSHYIITYSIGSFNVHPVSNPTATMTDTLITPYVSDYVTGSPSKITTTGRFNIDDTLVDYYHVFTSPSPTYGSREWPTIPGTYAVFMWNAVLKNGDTFVTSSYNIDYGYSTFKVLPMPLSTSVVVPNYNIGEGTALKHTTDPLLSGHVIYWYTYIFTTKSTGITYTSLPTIEGTYIAKCSPFIAIAAINSNATFMYSFVQNETEFTVSKRRANITPYMADYFTGTPSTLIVNGSLNLGDRIVSYNYAYFCDAIGYASNVLPIIPETYLISVWDVVIKNGNTVTTANYILGTTYPTFTVKPMTLSTSVTVPNYNVGETPILTKITSPLLPAHVAIEKYTFTSRDTNIDYTDLPSIVGTYTAMYSPIIINSVTNTIATTLYSFSYLIAEFTVSKPSLSITAVTSDYSIGNPSTPSYIVTGLKNEDEVSVTFTYEGTTMPTVSDTYTQEIKTLTILDKYGNDASHKYNTNTVLATFKVKIPVLVTYKVNDYLYGTTGIPYPEITGYDGNVNSITHEYGPSPDLPTNVGIYTISGVATIPDGEMYHVTYKNTKFRVLPRKITVKLNVEGTTVTPELFGTLRFPDTPDYKIKYGTSDTPPTIRGKYRVTVKVTILRGTEIVTSNYNVISNTTTIDIP